MDALIYWIIHENGKPYVVKGSLGFPSNYVGMAPEGFLPGDERFMTMAYIGGRPAICAVNFEAWRESRLPKENFFTRLKAAWTP